MSPEQEQITAFITVVDTLKENNIKLPKSRKTAPKKQKGKENSQSQATEMTKEIPRTRKIVKCIHKTSGKLNPPKNNIDRIQKSLKNNVL